MEPAREKTKVVQRAVNSKESKDEVSDLYIPIGITTQDILPRLGARTLLRFRSVCKYWSSLPHDFNFARAHLDRMLNTPSKVLMFFQKGMGNRTVLFFHCLDAKQNWNTSKLMFKFQLPANYFNMRQLCDGLVCFGGIKGREEIYICNPSIHKCVLLPKISFDIHMNGCYNVVGFGFDIISKKYKVICGFYIGPVDTMKRLVLTLGSIKNRWRRVDDTPYPLHQNSQNVYLNGSVHWIIDDSDGILCFNFEDEKYNVLPLPNGKFRRLWFDAWGVLMQLKVIRSYLHFVNTTTLHESVPSYWVIDFWKLKDYGNHVWAREFKIVLNEVCGFSLDRNTFPIPIDLQNGNVLILKGRELLIHNLERNVTRKINCDFPDIIECGNTLQPNYVESLIWVYDRY